MSTATTKAANVSPTQGDPADKLTEEERRELNKLMFDWFNG